MKISVDETTNGFKLHIDNRGRGQGNYRVVETKHGFKLEIDARGQSDPQAVEAAVQRGVSEMSGIIAASVEAMNNHLKRRPCA